MKKEVVHKVVVHNFVNLIEKSHKIDFLSIFFTSVCLRRFFLLTRVRIFFPFFYPDARRVAPISGSVSSSTKR